MLQVRVLFQVADSSRYAERIIRVRQGVLSIIWRYARRGAGQNELLLEMVQCP